MRTRLPGEANAWGLFIRRLAVTLTIFASVANCNLLKKKTDADAGDDAEAAVVETVDAAPAPTAPAALATNEGDVARFPDETKLADVAATTLRPFNVREAPPAGDLVLLIPKATVVTQIAQRDKFFLITFDNPNAPGTRLMGWVHRDAFSAVVVDAGPLVCKTGEVALVGDTPFCGKLCNVDTDCPAGQACRGSGTKLLPNGKPGDGVQVCTAYHPHDAGAPPTPPPTVVDSGAPAPAKDAGLPPIPNLLDAGLPKPPAGSPDVIAATAGKCAAGYVFVKKTGKCHRPCTNAVKALLECKNRPFFCIKCDGDKVVCSESQTQCR